MPIFFASRNTIFDDRVDELKQLFFELILRQRIGDDSRRRFIHSVVVPRVRRIGGIDRIDADLYITFFEQRIFLRFKDLHVELIAFETEFARGFFDRFLFGFSFILVYHNVPLAFSERRLKLPKVQFSKAADQPINKIRLSVFCLF